MRTDSYPNVSIRGVGAFGLTQGVGFHVDGVQIYKGDASSRFGDIERIEVLKGPQGTMYGGSNIGGAVKYITKRPSADGFEGRVKFLGGEQGIADGELSLNVPIDDNWAMRVFGYSRTDDGFMTNPNSPPQFLVWCQTTQKILRNMKKTLFVCLFPETSRTISPYTLLLDIVIMTDPQITGLES